MLSFIPGTGELANRIRDFDWERTSLGVPTHWPVSLKTLVSVMLSANQPMFTVWGPEQLLLYNDHYIDVLQGHHPAALGQPFLHVWREIADDLRPLVEGAYAGNPSHMEDITLMMQRNGYPEEAHFAYSYTPVRHEGGVVDGFFCACIETTEQVMSARRITESELRHRQIYDSASDYAIIATDLRGCVTSWNAGAHRVLGWTEKEMLGEALDRFFTPEDRASGQPRKELQQALQCGHSPDERWHQRKNGERFWASGQVTPLHDGTGQIVGFVKVMTDRTGERRVDEALRDLNAKLEDRVATEIETRLKIEDALHQSQKVEAIGQLTGGVAHDFNNLLTVIRGSVDLLLRPNVPEERRLRHLNAIGDTADRAAKLTSQLLAFARRQTLKPETFDAGASVLSIQQMMHTLTGSRIKIDAAAVAPGLFINVDRSQFETALVNIAVNARDAMKGQGTLTMSVEAAGAVPAVRSHPSTTGRYVAIALTDTGSGIPADTIGRVFEPFFTTKDVGEGTGLGLSQVFGFTRQSDGQVTVSSMEGQGSTFTIYLPQTMDPGDAASIPAKTLPIAHSGGLSVLVVEDNAEVGRFATQALAELGYETTLTVDAASALAELTHAGGRFDVVFSDVMMPGMSGIDLSHEVARRYPWITVVLASGYSTVLANDEFQGAKMLHKPYSLDDLSMVMRQATAANQRNGRRDD